ncbi:helix-turn-helix domain-containing protein [Aneurinibacillus tyrosinisolvens]|uniref:helix-turn-helix domain-containing protein n=1 Tax=Aneurinibacillus tyrosinisolvens TaxID=1443435 RepID=UPI00069BAE4F|nr:helix-turn-helix transcriptional regulator [Aneurinibacillus tyrosinisolvens]
MKKISQVEMEKREQFVTLRRRKKLQAKTVAEYIGCSQALISKYERGESYMSEVKVKLYEKFITDYEEKRE